MPDEVKEILSKYTDVESITEDLSLTKDLGLTSLDVVSMVGDFEDAFDIEIVDEEGQLFAACLRIRIADRIYSCSLDLFAVCHEFIPSSRNLKTESFVNLLVVEDTPGTRTGNSRDAIHLAVKRRGLHKRRINIIDEWSAGKIHHIFWRIQFQHLASRKHEKQICHASSGKPHLGELVSRIS